MDKIQDFCSTAVWNTANLCLALLSYIAQLGKIAAHHVLACHNLSSTTHQEKGSISSVGRLLKFSFKLPCTYCLCACDKLLMHSLVCMVPKPTSALFRVDEPETKVEFPKRKWSSRNESRVPETKVRVPKTKVEFPKRSSRNQSRSSRNETGGPKTKKGLGNNRHGQKINNDLHEFTCACGDLFLMHDSISWALY